MRRKAGTETKYRVSTIPQQHQELQRFATHGFILLVALVTALIRGVGIYPSPPIDLGTPIWESSPVEPSSNTTIPANMKMGSLRAIPILAANLNKVTGNAAALALDLKSPDQVNNQGEIITYEVVEGDTPSGIAERFGISADHVLWSNNLKDGDFIKPGQKLDIPPVPGVVHLVTEGESLVAIANWYSADANSIVGFSASRLVNPDNLQVGQKIVVPRGVRPPDPPKLLVASSVAPPPPPPAPVSAPAPAPAPVPPPPPAPVQSRVEGGVLQWPTYGPIFTEFSGWHKGLDISPPYGSPVVAAEAGVVSNVQQVWDYGLYIVIDHGNGFITLYAHISQAMVSPGQVVSRGSVIGRVGATGRATGPHLHFEVRYGGVPVNPRNYLQ